MTNGRTTTLEEALESLRETLEVQADESLMSELLRSLREAEIGETIPWETVKTELDL